MVGVKMERRTKFGWILAALVILIAVVVLSINVLLKSAGFKNYAIRKITEAANQATGGKTEIHNMDFTLSTLTAHLYHVTVRGTEPVSQPPLLQIDKLTVSFKIQSILHRAINLSDLAIEHPVVHLEVDRNGQNNLPAAPASSTSSHTNVFDMAVHHVLLTNGDIYYADKKTPMEADLYNVGVDIHYDLLAGRYRGNVSYDNGRLQYAHYAPLPHSLHASFSATPSLLSLEPVALTIGSSTATLRLQITNYARPDIDGEYKVQIHTQDFAGFVPGTAPAGDVLLTGKLRDMDIVGQPLLHTLHVDGELSSEALSVAASTGHIEAHRLRGNYHLANGSMQASALEVQSLGGIVRASFDARHLDATPYIHIRATVRGISLQDAQKALGRPELRQVALFGTLEGNTEASWTGNIQNLQARSDLSLRGGARNPKSVNGSSRVSVPVDGVVHITYDGTRGTIGLRSSTLRIPSAQLTAQGEISDRSNLQIQTTVSDLHQIAALLFAFRPNSSPPPAVAGSATFNATVRGSVKRPQIAGEVNAANLKVEGSEWRTAQATVEASPSRFTISKGLLASAQRGQANFSATVSLRDWSYLPANPIELNLSVEKMSISDLQRLADKNYPVSGDLSAQIKFRGSQADPGGSGSVQIANGKAYGESVQNVALTFRAGSGSIYSSADITLTAGSAKADLTFVPKTQLYNIHFDAPSIVLQKLQSVQAKNLPLSGTVTASATGNGTLDNPQFNALIQLPKLAVRDKVISDIKVRLDVAEHKANFNLTSEVVNASIQGHGEVNLTGDYAASASIDTSSIPLDVLLATYVPNLPQDFKGQTEFHATLKGPLKDSSQLEAHLTIPIFNATYQSLQIGAAAPIHLDYARSIVTIQPAEIRGTGTSLHLQGAIPLSGDSGSTFVAQGTVDMSVAQVFLPDTKSSGVLAIDLRASPTAGSPNMRGQVRLQNVTVLQNGAPLSVEKLNGTLNLDNEKVYLNGISAQVGGGQLSAGGSITYKPGIQFNLALEGHSIRLRYPDGLRSLLDGNLALTGTKDASVLNGRVLIDSLSFTPDFDLAKFADQFTNSTATPTQPGFADTIRLSLAVQSQDNLSATSSQISIAGRVNLHVSGTAADPVITGRTDLTSGELFYRNVRYQLQRGIITFEDPNETQPILNVSVTSTVEQYNLTLNLRGPFDKLTTSYVSDPPLATADIINLLANGQTTSESAASQSTDSMIASQAASQFSGSVQKLAGLSSLQIDPLIGGSNQNPSARIAVQQRVTKNFLFTFSTDVSQPGSEIVEGDYQINKRWSVSVARQEAGGVSAEGRFHTRF